MVDASLISVSDIVGYFLSALVLWTSAKFLDARLNLLSAFLIILMSSAFSILAPLVLPLNIIVLFVIGFLIRLFLIASFGQVGIVRALIIDIFPTLVLAIIIILFTGAIGALSVGGAFNVG